jgi:hypothetical protein
LNNFKLRIACFENSPAALDAVLKASIAAPG